MNAQQKVQQNQKYIKKCIGVNGFLALYCLISCWSIIETFCCTICVGVTQNTCLILYLKYLSVFMNNVRFYLIIRGNSRNLCFTKGHVFPQFTYHVWILKMHIAKRDEIKNEESATTLMSSLLSVLLTLG